MTEGTKEVFSAFSSGKPFTIGKIGANELNSLLMLYLKKNSINHPILQHAGVFLHNITRTAGLYPESHVDAYMERFQSYLKDLDICALWNENRQFETSLMLSCNPRFIPIALRDIEPFYSDRYWTSFLHNKKVLVVSSFSKSIETQYAIRDRVWPNGLLPDFDLITLQFPTMYYLVDSLKQAEYPENSLALLDEYIARIRKIDFDVMLVGAGAYSIPLIAEAKRMGKIGVHLGGGLQIVFGIKGGRWDNHPVISKFYNEHWKRPYPEETPVNQKIAEGGAYW